MAEADTSLFQKLIKVEEALIEFKSFSELIYAAAEHSGAKQPDFVHWFGEWVSRIEIPLYDFMTSFHEARKEGGHEDAAKNI